MVRISLIITGTSVFIDLTVPLNNQTPVYPGDPAVKVEPVAKLEKDGFTDHLLTTGNHAGTHIDAPMHMMAGGKSLTDFDISKFVGPGKLVEVKDHEFNLETVKAAEIQAGDIVLFYTGMDKHFYDESYYGNYPAMPEEVAEYLVALKVKMAGFDTGSADKEDGFPIHKTLLGGDVLIIENLINLDQLIGKNFQVFALPLKLDVDGAPARVIAQLES
jgi:arylformamidase